MKTIIMKTFAAGILLTMLFTGCTKTGPVGPAGTNGTNGNANVITTNTVTLSSWTHITSNDSYKTTVTTSAISQAVVDQGIVMVYIKSANGWLALPFHGVSYKTDFLQYEIINGGVNIVYTDDSPPTIDPTSSNWVIKLVIVPHQMKKANVNPNSYADVKAAYNLKD